MLNRILTKLTALHEIHTTKKRRSKDRRLVLALSIFPGRCQPSIVDRNELNYRVRNGNGWTLILISTNYMSSSTARKQTILYCPSRLLSRHFLSGDPYRIRTDVKGVRGLCLNRLTNGPYKSRRLPIFTSRFQLTIFGTSKLNFCVRNGNRWNLTVIDTDRFD